MGDQTKIGIDIGSATVKLVELAPLGKDKWKLLAGASVATPPGGIMGNQNNLASLSSAIVRALKESGARSRKAVAALPEEQVSSHVVEMPLMSDDEVQQALQWQVEQYIPIPAERAVWSHQVIKKDTNSGGMEVLLVAVSKTLVNSVTTVLEQAGLEPVALETELMATARAEIPPEFPLSMVVDIGARGSDLGVVRSGQLVFSRTIPTAGEAFTRAIESALGLDTLQAEQYRNAYGFSNDKLQGKLVEVMRPVLNVIANEIKKTGDFYSSKHSGEVIRLVTLSGGVALLPEVASILSGMVGMEVAIGNPFAKVVLDKNQAAQLSSIAAFYGVAVGLAMRTL